jgi:hypothetical protein
VQARRVFVTSSTFQATLGGLAGADSTCNTLAQGAGLTGTYVAWLSTGSVAASSRVSQVGGPFVLRDGAVVASDWAGLTSGNLAHIINENESGVMPSTSATACAHADAVWTNTSIGGGSATASGDCMGWTSSDPSLSSYIGTWQGGGISWTAGGVCNGCAQQARLYCIEQ